jgi:uroporphyrinogen-III synthase
MRLAVARFVSDEAPTKTRVLLYIAGAHRSRELAAELAPVLGPAGLTVRTVIGYRAVPALLSEPALAALRGREIDAVVHFSRRSARFYLDGAAPSGAAAMLSPMHYCIATPVADILREAGAARVTVAKRPEEAALLDAIG